MSIEKVYSSNNMEYLKQEYPRRLEWAFIITILLLIVIFYSMRNFTRNQSTAVESFIWKPDVIMNPPTIQNYRKPKPTLPKIPVPSEKMDLAEEVFIDFGDVDMHELIAFSEPPAEAIEIVPFVLVEQKPTILKRIQPRYPDLARKAGVVGTVVVNVLIGTSGKVEKAELLKSIPMLDSAALEAARMFEFSPAMQRDKYVRVWLSIPFKFTLN